MRPNKAFSFNEGKFIDNSQRACGPDEKSQNIPEDLTGKDRISPENIRRGWESAVHAIQRRRTSMGIGHNGMEESPATI
jgi:hypothetical protein